ncbi:hypothetical protein NQ314_020698 [Rhamnusium bicolor]|uniref:Chromatin-remodeling ATPase INO80 n=1 Tax=Rhamnusium bicolor TaxID=1586634 RepID=A0AAV8WL89_9CUCU|nr:hypothetical protein NQ314_020698 [Rhamnusium bicolor]
MAKNMRNNYDQAYKIVKGDKMILDGTQAHLRASTSKPIHLRRVERALNLNMFLKNVNQQLILSSDSEDSDDDTPNVNNINIENILRGTNIQNNFDNHLFYGAGLISTVDHYPEIEKHLPVQVKRKAVKAEDTSKSPLYLPDILDDISDEPCLDLNLQNGMEFHSMEEMEESNMNSEYIVSMQAIPTPQLNMNISRKKAKKFRDEESRKKWEDMMTIKRKKLYTSIVKKEIGKQHRAKTNKHKEMLLQCKRVASHCAKSARQKALQSARTVKEQQWRMKRLARENIAYWKRSRRFDREVKKRLEKEAEEQRKIDHELVEAKRQQRKLNFLITQTELYAHFMSKKLGQVSAEEQLRILSQLDEENTIKLSCDTYDSEKARTKHFDKQANSCLGQFDSNEGEQPQPDLFRGKLKGYQLRGMNWLANLYSQGISGILADEMGLGKTVQSIAFLYIKYFNRIKWQYMILDEAQAIKSTSSMRWKTLLGFSCRNRLLLSGTPIQNSMAELWALLHFIMPTLFDSHEEFNEWFSKDIESHAENKTGIDEKHLSRLHMILKPFMLRRIKKDVENELSDKIEVMVYCPLTTRQNLLYLALKQKIKIEDLLHYTVGGGDSHVVDKNFTSNLMNLVMQFLL